MSERKKLIMSITLDDRFGALLVADRHHHLIQEELKRIRSLTT